MPTQNRPPISDFAVAGTWSGVVGSRYTLVATYPDPTPTDYLQHGTTAGNLAFGFVPFALPANASAISVQVRYYDAEPSAGTNNFAGRLRVGGAYFGATAHNPAGTTYTARSDNWAVNPQTGIAWTIADINGTGANPLQNFGLISTDANPAIRVSCIQLQVTYSVAGYLNNIQPRLVGKTIEFVDAGTASTATVTVQATINGVVTDITSYLNPSFVPRPDGIKFAFGLQVPAGAAGVTMAAGLQYLTFRVNSTYPLVEMGSTAVGYWLPALNEFQPIEALKYNFADVLRLFTTPAAGLVREYVLGVWTGQMIPGTIQQPVPYTVSCDAGGATITIDVRGIMFSAGQLIDLDPVTQTGSSLDYNCASTNTGTASSAITVPSDATLVIVGISGYKNIGNYFSGGGMTFTKGAADAAMKVAVTGASGGDSRTSIFMCAMFYLESPDTGSSKSLKWDWAGTEAPIDAPLASVTFWKGNNTTEAKRGAAGGQNGTFPYTSGTITANSGDKLVAFVAGYVYANGTVDSWTNATLVAQCVSYNSADGAWASGDPSGNTTVAATTGTNFSDGGIVGISLIPAADAGLSISVARPYTQAVNRAATY